MAAPKGNTFYKFVKKPTGRPKKYTPNRLWKKAQEYFEWVLKNPLYEQKVFANGKSMNVYKMRAMTELAFCLYAGIDQHTFMLYKSGAEEYKDFFSIAKKISDIIYTQKFEGASADLLNSNIIARDLGLREKTELTGKDGKDLLPPKQLLDFSHLSMEEIDQLLSKHGKL